MHCSSGIETSSFQEGKFTGPPKIDYSLVFGLSLQDAVVRLYASAKSGNTNTVMLGDPDLKTLRL